MPSWARPAELVVGPAMPPCGAEVDAAGAGSAAAGAARWPSAAAGTGGQRSAAGADRARAGWLVGWPRGWKLNPAEVAGLVQELGSAASELEVG